MNAGSIDKFRRRFILLAGLAFFGVMFLISGLLFTTNLLVTRREARQVLNYLIENGGELRLSTALSRTGSEALTEAGSKEAASGTQTEHLSSEMSTETSRSENGSPYRRTDLTLPEIFGYRRSVYTSPEFLYSTRYFAVLFTPDGQVKELKTSHISSLSNEEAEAYARSALNRLFSFGADGTFYYKVGSLDDGGKIVVYLDSTNQLVTSRRLLFTALALITLGMCLALILLHFLSFRVIRQEMENAERQKQFITNASHELKTPLAVIRANTEVEQMINGENEWNQSTMRQVDRLTGLIGNLVTIARAEEKEGASTQETVRLDLSKVIEDTADTFRPVAEADQKTLKKEITAGVMLDGIESELRQLATLLIDNAIKYCDEQGQILVRLEKRSRTARLIVSNTYAEGANVDYSRFFDRFYRQDQAHNVDKGGYGIGLSIADSLVRKYNGTIDASWRDGMIRFTCVLHSIK